MSRKLSAHLKKIEKQNTKYPDNNKFSDGGAYVRHIYDRALRNIFGVKLGILLSDFLISEGLSDKKK